MTYYSLHNHTDYSNASCGFSDSINKLEHLVDRAKECGIKGVAITDHDCVSNHVKIVQKQKELREAGDDFKLILGNEIYLGRTGLTSENHQTGEKFYHFILLAKNLEGHKQMRELSTAAHSRGYFRAIQRRYNYLSEFQQIAQNKGNLIGTSACIGGVTGTYFLTKPREEAISACQVFIDYMQSMLGEENFYIELAPSAYEEQTNYNKFMYENFYGKVKFTIATDSHFDKVENYEIFKAFLNSSSNKKDREVDAFYKYAYMMNWEEVISLMGDLPLDFLEECRLNTIAIGDSVEDYDLAQPSILPEVPLGEETIANTNFVNKIVNYPNIMKMAYSEHKADRYYTYLIFKDYEKLIEPKYDEHTILSRIDLELSEILGISEVLNARMSNYHVTVAKIIDIMWEEADAIVGPSRGSAAAFITNYLIGITQWNPLDSKIPVPHWRYITATRPGLPDIDIDTPGNKKEDVLLAIRSYFRSLNGDMVQIAAFGTEGAKGAIKTAARGLGIDDDVANYASNMIVSDRGISYTLKQTYHGDEDVKPNLKFVEVMKQYPKLWEVAQRIEGLVTRLTIHAAGVVMTNTVFTDTISLMKTKNGVMISAYDLGDSEYCGLVKYDFLSIDATGKIHNALLLMLQANLIEWQGSLKETYKKYLYPNVLKEDEKLWANIAGNRIESLFQLTTAVGSQSLAKVHAKTWEELAIINSLMRLMPSEKNGEMPIDTFARYREDINLWYEEMRSKGLTQREIKILEPHLLPLSGVADSQESIMLIVMDKEISNFSVAEANILRKGIAKKSAKAQAEAKKMFYSKGAAQGNRLTFLDYVWNVQVARQLGYSFSSPHTLAYSLIALQEANLFTYYPEILWNTACLCTDSAVDMTYDFKELVEKGYLKPSIKQRLRIDDMVAETVGEEEYSEEELAEIKNTIIEEDEDGGIENAAVDRGKIASGVSKFKQVATILPPSVNHSGFAFLPNLEENAINCGLKIVGKIGDKLILDIINHRPYTSVEDFTSKVKISKDRVANLIKAGAFDELYKNSTREEILNEFIKSYVSKKSTLNLRNVSMLQKANLFPKEYFEQLRAYNWVTYVRKNKLTTNLLGLDDAALGFYNSVLDQGDLEYYNGVPCITKTALDSFYKKEMTGIKSFIDKNKTQLINTLYDLERKEQLDKYGAKDEAQGEMKAMRMYIGKHELDNAFFTQQVEITPLTDVIENDIIGEFYIPGTGTFPKYNITTIVGTVIKKDKLKSLITLLTPEGPIDVKVFKNTFAHYDKVSNAFNQETGVSSVQDSFFEVGTLLAVTGIKRGTNFVPKKYKATGVSDVIMKIILTKDNVVTYEPKYE